MKDGMSKMKDTRWFWLIVITVALIHFSASATMVYKYPEWGPPDDDPSCIPPPSLQERFYCAGLDILVFPTNLFTNPILKIMDYVGVLGWAKPFRWIVLLGLPLCLNSLLWGFAAGGVSTLIRKKAGQKAQQNLGGDGSKLAAPQD